MRRPGVSRVTTATSACYVNSVSLKDDMTTKVKVQHRCTARVEEAKNRRGKPTVSPCENLVDPVSKKVSRCAFRNWRVMNSNRNCPISGCRFFTEERTVKV